MRLSRLPLALVVAIIVSCALRPETTLGQGGKPAGKPGGTKDTGQDPRVQALYAQAFASLAGKENTWYVVSMQDVKVDGRLVTKKRSHVVVQGKDAAAKVIAQFYRGSSDRRMRHFVEMYPSEPLAVARAAWWRQYEGQAGYR